MNTLRVLGTYDWEVVVVDVPVVTALQVVGVCEHLRLGVGDGAVLLRESHGACAVPAGRLRGGESKRGVRGKVQRYLTSDGRPLLIQHTEGFSG